MKKDDTMNKDNLKTQEDPRELPHEETTSRKKDPDLT